MLPTFKLGFDQAIKTEGKVTFSKSFDDLPDAVFFATAQAKGGTNHFKLGVLRSLNN